MKLKRLKLNQDYRSLEQGFEIIFEPDLSSEKLDPICFVGPNGSGKSNVLEALADIFYYLESYLLNYTEDDENTYVNTISAFVIEYYLPLTMGNRFIRFDQAWKWDDKYFRIKIIKEENDRPQFLVVFDKENQIIEFSVDVDLDNEYKRDECKKQLKELLPKKIWGYSSGHNEILSLPFYKMDLYYFRNLSENISSDGYEIIEDNRFHYIDYETTSSILLSNFIVYNGVEEKLDVFKNLFEIEQLTFVKFTINKYYWVRNKIKIPNDIKKFIRSLSQESKLKHCVDGDIDDESLKVTFSIDLTASRNIEAFKSLFVVNDANSLYKFFEKLNIININSVEKKRSSEALFGNDNFYSLNNIGTPPSDKKPFVIEELKIKKVNIEEPIEYRYISDGEHQALLNVGLFNMLDEDGVLYLLDEPDTHLNPKWKYDFINTISNLSSNYKNQVLITTHDPIFISGLKKENVILFNNKANTSEEQNRWRFPDKDLIGQGVDSILTSDIFGFQTTLDNPTQKQLIERRILLVKQLKSELSDEENERLKTISEYLSEIDYANPINDPLYADFINASENLDFYSKKIITQEERIARKERARISLEKLKNYGSR